MMPTDLAAAALGAAGVYALVRLAAGAVLSGQRTQAVLARLPASHHDPVALQIHGLLDYWIGPRTPMRRFLAATLVATLTGTAIALLAFIAGLPPYFAAFGSSGGLWAFVSRFIASQSVVAFVVNYLSFTALGLAARSVAIARPPRLLVFTLMDFAARIALFGGISAGIYAAYARLAGSFGGSWRTAVAVVPETMLSASRFNNLTGVVLYGVVASSFPLFLALAYRFPPARTSMHAATARMAAALSLAAFALSLAAAG
ncbi:MAG: hypothetical protein R3D65_11580 [Zhengella sp.]|uniref:hypothetical protein n=1 Tax=Zhengella sp. TaxID=2282762 RepID=UPI00352854EB|nr:hypothetical protein [Brucellaceae bacterium]